MNKLKQIDAYLSDALTAEQKREVEIRMAKDPGFAREVEMHREVNMAIQDDDVVEFGIFLSERYHGNAFERTPSVKLHGLHRFMRYAMAVVIVFLFGVSGIQLYKKIYQPSAFEKFYTPYHADLVTRSGQKINMGVQAAYMLYDEGDYATSSELFKDYLLTHPDDMTAHFYFGLNAIELGLSEMAIEELLRVEEDDSTPFSLHARWYLALCYVARKDYQKAIPYLKSLSDNDSVYSVQARKLKRSIAI